MLSNQFYPRNLRSISSNVKNIAVHPIVESTYLIASDDHDFPVPNRHLPLFCPFTILSGIPKNSFL